MSKTVILLAMMISTVGCAPSLVEMRGQAPRYAGAFPRDYKAMAACTLEQARLGQKSLRGDLGNLMFLPTNGPDSASVTGYHDVDEPWVDVTFTPEQDGTRVEAHSRHQRYADKMWSVVQGCAHVG